MLLVFGWAVVQVVQRLVLVVMGQAPQEPRAVAAVAAAAAARPFLDEEPCLPTETLALLRLRHDRAAAALSAEAVAMMKTLLEDMKYR